MEKIERQNHKLDATGAVLGRLASRIAVLLRGKHKSGFTPYLDQGDFVAVINVDKLKITGTKMNQKIYYRSSMHPGGLKKTKMKDLAAKKGYSELLRLAVSGMLPANKLKNGLMKRLTIK